MRNVLIYLVLVVPAFALLDYIGYEQNRALLGLIFVVCLLILIGVEIGKASARRAKSKDDVKS